MTNLPASMSEIGTTKLFFRLWRRLRSRRKKQFIFVTALMVVSAFAEVATLGAVIPFITVLVDPERVFSYGLVADLAQLVGVDEPGDLVLPLALVFVAGAVLAAAIRLVVLWSSTRLAMVTGADLSAEAYERTLYQPYAIHIGRNTSSVTSGVIHKVEAVVWGLFMPIRTLIGSLFT
ncbi:uncharacterized protein METZ01_LOCUS89950, partial [marine metagenome]